MSMSPDRAVAKLDQGRADVTATDPCDDLVDAHHAIGYAGTWINNADTKAGLLAAALAVVVAGATQQAEAMSDALRPGDGSEVAALILLCLLGAAVATATVGLALATIPRTPPPQAPSRFGFPTLASHGWRHVPATRAQAAAEAWGQAQVLAGIAARKYVRLRVAMTAAFASLPLYAAWSVAAALIR